MALLFLAVAVAVVLVAAAVAAAVVVVEVGWWWWLRGRWCACESCLPNGELALQQGNLTAGG